MYCTMSHSPLTSVDIHKTLAMVLLILNVSENNHTVKNMESPAKIVTSCSAIKCINGVEKNPGMARFTDFCMLKKREQMFSIAWLAMNF